MNVVDCSEKNDKGFMCAVVKLCGVKRNNAATIRILAWEKTYTPESDCSGMERNERMNDSSCVGLALRCE